MRLTLKNLGVLRDFARAAKAVSGSLHIERVKLGKEAVAYARAHHRFENRTGRLRSAVNSNVLKDTVRVRINDRLAPYGKYLHNGTRHIADDPFVEKAVEKVFARTADREISTAVVRPFKRKRF